MDNAQIISTVNRFLAEDFEIPVERLTPDANLKDTLDLDSLDYVDLVVSIERNFGFKVNPEDFQHMITVADFYQYVATKSAEKLSA